MQYDYILLQISQANYIEKYSAPHKKIIFFVWITPKLKKFVYNIYKIKIYLFKLFILNLYISKVYRLNIYIINIYQFNLIFSNRKNKHTINLDQCHTGTSIFFRSSHV